MDGGWFFASVVVIVIGALTYRYPRQTLITLGVVVAIAVAAGWYFWGRQFGVDISASYTPTVAPC